MDNEVKVSVICLTYNHENYIRSCLEGFVMQKTNFKFEVLVHDDASTDKTADIIREYEKEYPDIIKPIYQTENQHSKGTKIIRTCVFPSVKGKYVAFCEGDDYWCDENKLQRQFDLMEANDGYSACVHKVDVIDSKSNEFKFTMPRKSKKQVINTRDYLDYCLRYSHFFQTSSYFIRKDILFEYYNNVPQFKLKINVGDAPMLLFAVSKGKIAYIDETMSNYRFSSDSSWTLKMLSNKNRNFRHKAQYFDMYYEYNIFTNYKYLDVLELILKKEAKTVYYYGKKIGIRREDLIKYHDFLTFKERFEMSLKALFFRIYERLHGRL